MALTPGGDEARLPPGPAERQATRAAFFIAGFGVAAWAPLVPYAKHRLVIGDAALGALLLCFGAGSLLSMPLAGALAARFGCRRVICTAILMICLALPCLATATSITLVAAALMVFGAGVGAVDVAMNIQAVIVERTTARPMMSGFHGLFSAGGIAGAAGVSAVLWASAAPLLATLCAAGVIVAVLLLFGRDLLPHGGDSSGASFALPRGIVLLIGGMCFVCFLAEGAVLDWGALVLTTLHDMEPIRAGLGYAVFSVTMTGGRFLGDRVVHGLGAFWVLLSGGAFAAAGLTIAVLGPSALAALAGFALIGLGSSNIVPVLYSALGRQRAMPPHLAVSATTTVGYAGILVGPAAIGFVAAAAGLGAAFLGVAALLLLLAACSGMVHKS